MYVRFSISIAHRYNFLNHALSFGIDIIWRRRAIKLLQPLRPKQILDVATGTADLVIEAIQLNAEQIICIDISSKMLEIGRNKIRSKKIEHLIKIESGEAEHLRFETGSFDLVMAGFGVRNFSDLELGLKEFYRVLRVGGCTMILEFSKPKRFPIKQIFNFYSKYFFPLIGGIVSNNRSAYKYLPNTVGSFRMVKSFARYYVLRDSRQQHFIHKHLVLLLFILQRKNRHPIER